MLGVAGGSGLLTRIIFGGVCDNINVRREENELGGVLTVRAGEREREREKESYMYTKREMGHLRLISLSVHNSQCFGVMVLCLSSSPVSCS